MKSAQDDDKLSPPRPDEQEPAAIDESDILIVRRGPGANCSSIGSALDVLFLSAVAAGAVVAGVAAAVGDHAGPKPPPAKGSDQSAERAPPAPGEESNASST